ncbi:MAG TPA: RdgB/HAM1 family non-canonical purine NTP pyrophosphatase [Syntrophorhabdaceae bacterium]|nr:RdgB/HAM1 family non-canonical purine NTP pyrophosphatase [Syntrophorhabdaceae bacterium]
MRDVIIATENVGKYREIVSLLDNTFDRYHSLKDFTDEVTVNEDQPHYVSNALKKARKVGDRFGMAALSDDSGLEVSALQGRPGLYSSRYGKDDEDRIARLLNELKDVPPEKRQAVFKSYVVLYLPETDRWYVFYGELRGFIGLEKHGTGGFGYDPVFYEPVLGKYLAELSVTDKNTLSHRGRALLSMKTFLNVDFYRSTSILAHHRPTARNTSK